MCAIIFFFSPDAHFPDHLFSAVHKILSNFCNSSLYLRNFSFSSIVCDFILNISFVENFRSIWIIHSLGLCYLKSIHVGVCVVVVVLYFIFFFFIFTSMLLIQSKESPFILYKYFRKRAPTRYFKNTFGLNRKLNFRSAVYLCVD